MKELMLLVIDVGNTNIKLGIYVGDELKWSWRLAVKVTRTSDEFGILLNNLFATQNVTFGDIGGIILSSVSPELNYTVEHACLHYMNLKPMLVEPGIKTGINIKYTNPYELGSDRIVNSVAAYKLYGGPCIIIDFGTATTFNVVSETGQFLGGAIAPGIKSSMEGLIDNTAKLTRVELSRPENVIGKNTAANIQSGVIYGFCGLASYMIERLRRESGFAQAKVIATGGLSKLVADEEPELIDIIDRSLTLKGLKIIYDLNT